MKNEAGARFSGETPEKRAPASFFTATHGFSPTPQDFPGALGVSFSPWQT